MSIYSSGGVFLVIRLISLRSWHCQKNRNWLNSNSLDPPKKECHHNDEFVYTLFSILFCYYKLVLLCRGITDAILQIAKKVIFYNGSNIQQFFDELFIYFFCVELDSFVLFFVYFLFLGYFETKKEKGRKALAETQGSMVGLR